MFFYRKLRKRLRNAYGKRPQGEYYDGDMNWISTFYEDCRKDGRDPFYVDDITWNDLNMDAVYKRINCCRGVQADQLLLLHRGRTAAVLYAAAAHEPGAV